MSYTKLTDFGAKDSLPSGDPDKIVKGSEINTEFNNIQTAISTLNTTVSGLSGGGSVTDITYAAGSQYLTAGTSTTQSAPNPGAIIGWVVPGPNYIASIKAAVNGGSITLQNTSSNTATTSFWLKIGHSS